MGRAPGVARAPVGAFAAAFVGVAQRELVRVCARDQGVEREFVRGCDGVEGRVRSDLGFSLVFESGCRLVTGRGRSRSVLESHVTVARRLNSPKFHFGVKTNTREYRNANLRPVARTQVEGRAPVQGGAGASGGVLRGLGRRRDFPRGALRPQRHGQQGARGRPTTDRDEGFSLVFESG